MSRSTLMILTFFVTGWLNAAEYREEQDDFSNKKNKGVSYVSEDERSRFNIACIAGKKTSIYLETLDTLFPDDTNFDKNSMTISFLYKFDTAKKPHKFEWDMNMMKYQSAYLPKHHHALFLRESVQAGKLAIKTNRGDVYRFDFTDSGKLIIKAVESCLK